MQKKGRFDQIILETTGLADPLPIIKAFWNEPTLGLGDFTRHSRGFDAFSDWSCSEDS